MVIHICQKCKKIFNYKNDLRRHLNRKKPCMIQSIPIQNINCPKCGKTYSNKYNLKRHLQQYCKIKLYDNTNPLNNIIKLRTDFECPNCNKTFTRKSSLTRHLKQFCKIKEIDHNKSDLSINDEDILNQHVAKIFVCNYCERSFTRKNNLQNHQKDRCKIKNKINIKEQEYQQLIDDVKYLKKKIVKQENEINKLKEFIIQINKTPTNNNNNLKNKKHKSNDSHNYETIKYNDKRFLIIKKNKIIWFKTIDIANILECDNHKSVKEYIEDYDKMEVDCTIFINESGLYSLISNLKSQKANDFRKWVTTEMLPIIRKYKSYAKLINYEHKNFYDDNLISQFENKNVVYIGYVGVHNNEHIFKFGKTRNIYNRDIKKHRSNFNFFEIIYVKDCVNYEIVEKQFKKELIAKKIHRKLNIRNKTDIELFTITNKISIDDIKRLMDDIIDFFPINKDLMLAKYEYDIYKEKNDHLKLQIEYEKVLTGK